jgi:DNA-binding FadR family transcriptional regulator
VPGIWRQPPGAARGGQDVHGQGLLAAHPRRGTWVQPEDQWNLLDADVLGWLLERNFSPALLVEFTELRLAVEPVAAMLAVRAAGPEEKAALSRAIEGMQADDRGDDDPLESDIAFHVAVLGASRNRFYAQLADLPQRRCASASA